MSFGFLDSFKLTCKQTPAHWDSFGRGLHAAGEQLIYLFMIYDTGSIFLIDFFSLGFSRGDGMYYLEAVRIPNPQGVLSKWVREAVK